MIINYLLHVMSNLFSTWSISFFHWSIGAVSAKFFMMLNYFNVVGTCRLEGNISFERRVILNDDIVYDSAFFSGCDQLLAPMTIVEGSISNADDCMKVIILFATVLVCIRTAYWWW